jgi:hypothetical protein
MPEGEGGREGERERERERGGACRASTQSRPPKRHTPKTKRHTTPKTKRKRPLLESNTRKRKRKRKKQKRKRKTALFAALSTLLQSNMQANRPPLQPLQTQCVP